MVRVVAYTAEPLVAFALSHFLGTAEGIEAIKITGNPEDLKGSIATDRPDVAIISLSKGIDASVLHLLQASHSGLRIILWVPEDIPVEIAHQAIVECGVRGILRRTLSPEHLVRCIHKVAAGELWLEESLMSSFLTGRSVQLTRREGQLVRLLAQGLKNKEISTALNISEGTVKVYFSKLFVKLGVKDRFELALFGLRNLQYGTGSASVQVSSLFVSPRREQPKPLETDRRRALGPPVLRQDNRM
jgi:two-component system nitrate/nitrite response regulator NarL